jgi:hypothetical protein
LKLAAVGATLTEDETSALLCVLEAKEAQGGALRELLEWPVWFAD